MTTETKPSNLGLWDSVRTPDPHHTKKFKRGGGFEGTAINAVYLIRLATETWGPMGGAWGIDIVDERIELGAPLLKGELVIGHEKVHVLRINLRHPGGVVPAFGQTTFVGTNKYGAYTDEEAPKKSLTDALTKALSWLGFAADIHMGLWDDNKYLTAVHEAFSETDAPMPGATAKKPDIPKLTNKEEDDYLKQIAAAKTTKQCNDIKVAAKQRCEELGNCPENREAYSRITAAARTRAEVLLAAQPTTTKKP